MRFKPLIRKLMNCGTRITVFIHLFLLLLSVVFGIQR